MKIAGANPVRARLVVAANGRYSPLARLAGVEAKEMANDRFILFVPMRNVDLKRGSVSQMWLYERDVAYVFPNDDAVTVVAWIASKDRLEASRDEPLEALKRRFRTLPEAPQLDVAELAGNVLLVKDYPNLWRPPVVRGMALVGDALASMDPLWGVGCEWALQTGAWLADAAPQELGAGELPVAGLRAYKKACARLSGHRFLISDFSRRHTFNPVERSMFSAATRDPRMALHLNRFGARLIGPSEFLRPSMLLRALWINSRHRGTSPGDTRSPSVEPTVQARAEALP